MGSGYKILWTDHALKELAETYEYLELNFRERELNKLSIELDKILKLIVEGMIGRNPRIDFSDGWPNQVSILQLRKLS